MGLKNDIKGVAPFIALIAIIVVGSVAVGGTYMVLDQLSERPDITYNVVESPFSFFGNTVDWIWIIIIGVLIVFVLLWIFGKSKQKTQIQPKPYYRNGR